MTAAFEGDGGTGVDAAAGREEWRSAGSRLADDVGRVRSGRDLQLLDLLELARKLGPDPAFDELDDEVLVAEAGRQAARVAAATCRYVQLVAELVVRGVWADHGARTPAQWLSFEHGMGSSTAAEHIRVGLRLRQLPVIRERFAAGELSYSKVRAITRVAVPELESMLVQWCHWATGAEIEELVTGFRRSCRATADEQVPDRQRSWSRHSNGDGTSRFVIRMPDDEAAAFEAGLERLLELEDADSAEDVATVAPGGSVASDVEDSRASSDADDSRASSDAEGSRASSDEEDARAATHAHGRAATASSAEDASASHAHGRAATASSAEDARASDDDAGDAEGLQQLLALDALDETAFVPAESRGLADADGAPQQHGQRTRAARMVDAVQAAVAAAVADGGADTSGLDRHTLVLQADGEVLGHDGATQVPVRDARGRRLAMSARVLRRLACEAGVVIISTDDEGRPLDVGRRQREPTTAQRRALLARDRGCRFPGCRTIRHLHAHHVVHWADEGPTDLDNLVLLCSFHHRFVHDHHWRVAPAAAGTFRFAPPGGEPLPTARPLTGAPAGPDVASDLPVASWALRATDRSAVNELDLDTTVSVLHQELDLLRRANAPAHAA